MHSKSCYLENSNICSICRKQNEYFDKGYVARFLTFYIYNGAFCDNSVRLDPKNSYYLKELRRRLGRVPKIHLFGE